MIQRPPFRSTPPSQPSPYRYLGGGGGERPVRVQVIIGLVAGLILVAVPLYLWRRPQPGSIPLADAAVAETKLVDAGPVAPVAIVDAGPPPIKLSPFTTIRCQNPGPGRTPPERCDHVTFFEDALATAIRESSACAPTGKNGADVSYVMEIDFRRKKMHLFAGKSTTVKRAESKKILSCVQRAMPTPDWGTIPHQYVKYKVNVIASYPPSEEL